MKSFREFLRGPLFTLVLLTFVLLAIQFKIGIDIAIESASNGELGPASALAAVAAMLAITLWRFFKAKKHLKEIVELEIDHNNDA